MPALSAPPADPAAAYNPGGRYDAPRRSRYVSAVLAGLVTGGLLLVLIAMAVEREPGTAARAILTAMNLSPPPGEKQPNPTKQMAAKAHATHPVETTVAPKLPPHIDVNNPNKVEWPEGFIHTSHAEMAAADISNIHSSAASGTGNASAGGGGGHGGGQGEGGNSFYNVDWYRKPPHSVFDNYMRPGQSTGKLAEIDCRMIEDYHVEDCHEVREIPRGTGMARVMREASWQFLVRPPRLNGKPLLGTRVRITYTFTDSGESEGPRTGEAP